MILTPEEQAEAREEIDYLIETNGYEYVWGKETAMDKTKGLIRDVPTKLIEGAKKLASNPDIIAINEKLKAHNAKLCEQEAKQRAEPMAGLPKKGKTMYSESPGMLDESPLKDFRFDHNDRL